MATIRIDLFKTPILIDHLKKVYRYGVNYFIRNEKWSLEFEGGGGTGVTIDNF
jgi:hypothetical protein